MKINTLIVFSLLVMSMKLNAQYHGICLNENIQQSSKNLAPALIESYNCSFNDVYSNSTQNVSYIPTVQSDIIIIRLNLHVMQKADGSGNFQNNATTTSYLESLINGVNGMYSGIQPPIWNGNKTDSYITDSKIRFQIDAIYFHQDDVANQTKPYDESYGKDNYSSKYGVNIDGSINVFFSELTNYYFIAGNGFGLIGEARNCVGMYSYYYNYLNNPSSFNVAVFTFAHELGHELGLMHTYQPPSGDELSDTYYPEGASWCNCGTDLNCSNNLMSASATRNYISPMQIGKMRRLATVGWRAKLQYNCSMNSTDFVVSTSTTWNLPMCLHGNVSINNSVLTVNCKVFMPNSKVIDIGSNAKLILDNGQMTNNCGSKVRIIVNNGGCLVINSSVINNCEVLVHGNGTLIIDGAVSLQNQGVINVESGGYACIRPNSTLNLYDSNSFINLRSGWNSGVNTLFVNTISDCVASMSSLTINGQGVINDYNKDVYLQNETISANRYIAGKNIYVGNHVTTNKQQGNVIINNNANVVFDAAENVILDAGFETTTGSNFEIKK